MMIVRHINICDTSFSATTMKNQEIARLPVNDPRVYHEPRAHLDGLNLPHDFSLPALTSVRADAVLSMEMRKRPEDYEDIVFMFPVSRLGSLANKETLPMHLKLALIFNMQLPNLFRFSYFTRVEDVPDDIIDDCTWALSLFIRIMEECTETALRAIGHVKGNNDYKQSKYLTLLNARGKMVLHLLNHDRAEEAVPFAKAMVDEECLRGNKIWLQNPMPFEVYGETLVLTRTDDDEAAKTLRRAMRGVESSNWPANAVSDLVKTKTWLARALRNIDLDNEAETHEKWLISWFRKNPHLMMEKDLRRLLLPAGPILEGLGGEKWLDNRKQTPKTVERHSKACRICGAREPLVTLLRCNNCKYIFYCSRDCQRAHWKHHKVECREMAANLEKIEHLSLTDPDGAKLAAHWSLWRNQEFTQFQLIHALGLHRDPKRGRTHIVLKAVEYVPAATKLQHKFRVVSCGVFRIGDVLRDIETVMGLDRGEGQEYVDSLFHELAGTHASVPFIDLTFGDGIEAWLGSGATNVDSILGLPYDPEWRKRFNVGAPPGPMALKSGAKDVEHVF
ncbi:hypothetical protein C8R45DRAFT_1016921 [Mycena sanguinolenta]|nr:hypothetical protein C8R45DRAFT_1016921 [Mycena sanguinolenta]